GRDERSFESAAASAPGIVPQLAGLQIFGSPATGTRYRIDGVDVTDPATNAQGRRLLQHFIDEVTVESSGLGAAYGRVAGGVIQAVTRSGGNDLHGSAFLDWMPIELPRKSLRYDLAGGAELGGPIERDGLAESTDVLPRAGIAWDFSGRGVSRAYAFVGRFFESPALISQRRTREHQLAAGVQSQIWRDVVASLDYIHKDFRDALDGRDSYDAATLSLAKPFSANSLLQASYTLSSLRGPGRNIAADTPNVLKLDAAYAYEW